MLLEAIYHKPYSEYAFPEDENTLVLRIRTRKDDLTNVILVYHEKYDESQMGSMLMEKAASDELFDYYEARLQGGIRRFRYMFYLEDAYEVKWYTTNGFSDQRPAWGLFGYSYICERDAAGGPDWFRNAVIYQIFPDRFHNPGCLPGSQQYRAWEKGQANKFSHFGGNLEGMIQKLDYLADLGINAIYLNPVFKAKSYHRYDTLDYYTIDPMLGDKRQFGQFVDACHKKGIRVILDAVFNHCCADFFAFRDVVVHGANSKYWDWFCIDSFPIKACPRPNYRCFSFSGDMPKFNTCNEDVIKYLYDITTFWIKEYDIDGWRFDVADEIDRRFWSQLREQVKAVKPDAVLIAEIWDDASSWVNGGGFESAVNYGLKVFINDLFAYKSINVRQFMQRTSGYWMRFHSNAARSLVNITGTHDTPRFMTLCSNNIKRFELGVVFQFTFPGVPLVYYGDEIGMRGEGDPDCRMPMVWEETKWNKEILRLYKFLIALRKSCSALTDGRYGEVETAGSRELLAYRRDNGKEAVMILMNVSDKNSEGRIKIGKDIKLLVNLKNSEACAVEETGLQVRLKPYEWRIYKCLLK